MPQTSKYPTANVPLYVLGAVCLITVFMCQIRFKISKEIKPEITPPVLKNNYVSLIYGFGKPDRFRIVLRAFILVSSPLLSLISAGLVMLGKAKSNPYMFLPWMFFTFRGIIFVQSENILGILKELFARYDQTYAFSIEDWKWSCLYFTMLFFMIAESFAVYEVFEVMRAIWNNQYNDPIFEPVKIEAVDLERNPSSSSLKSKSSTSATIQEYHTITSLCKFGFCSDQESDGSVVKLKSLIALFRKKY